MMSRESKVEPKVRELIVARRSAGFSTRDIAAWLSAVHGYQTSHTTVAAVLREAKAPAPPPKGTAAVEVFAAAPEAPAKPSVAVPEGAPVGGDDEIDLRALDASIRQLEIDEQSAREKGSTQSLQIISRLKLDALERRRRLRANVAEAASSAVEVDEETREAGARAVERLRKLVDAAMAAPAP